MKPEDARREVLIQLAERCGFEIPEQRLSGKTRSSIGSLATIYRHLIAVKETLRVEEANEARETVRIRRTITARRNVALKDALAKAKELQSGFQQNLDSLAGQIVSELGPMRARTVGEEDALAPSAPGPLRAEVTLEPLRCKSCGASLSPPTSKFIKCNYCGTEFEIQEYLENLGTAMKLPGKGDQTGPSA